MYDEEQLVEVRWNPMNKSWYEGRGYVYTGNNKAFLVKAKDLTTRTMRKIEAVCDYCGSKYTSSYCVIRSALDKGEMNACRHCASKKVNNSRRDERIEKYYNLVMEMCEKRGYTLLTPKNEIDNIKCRIELGTPSGVQTVWIENFIKGHDCRKESFKYRNYKRIDRCEILHRINSDGNTWLNQDEYTNASERCLKIRCKCGNTFRTSFLSYKNANINRCSTCVAKESLGEMEVRKALDELGVEYEKEKRYKDCRDKKPLPFDFYLKDYNLIIEFDGQNHFKPVFQNHEKTILHDEIKNKYCKDNNIILLRIPYWEGHNVKEIISNKIDEIKSKDIV